MDNPNLFEWRNFIFSNQKYAFFDTKGLLGQNMVESINYFLKLTKWYNQKLLLIQVNKFGQMNKNLVHPRWTNARTDGGGLTSRDLSGQSYILFAYSFKKLGSLRDDLS